MVGRARLLKRLFLDFPQHAMLAYCLAFDPRVPPRNKLMLAGGVALILSPFDLPAWIPVVGPMDALALTLLAARVFEATAPPEVVAEHRRLIRERRSRFDRDLAEGRELAVAIAARARAVLGAREAQGGELAAPRPVVVGAA